MLQVLEVDNFKSLIDFKMNISPMTVIVGNNAAGKSSVLQVLDLLCSCANEDFESIINRRNWNVADIRSKCLEKLSPTLMINSQYSIMVEDKEENIKWSLVLKYNVQKNSISLYSEIISNADTGEVYLEYSPKEVLLYPKSKEAVIYPHIQGNSSMLKVIVDMEKDVNKYPELTGLKAYLKGIRSFELLSPDQMRSSSRGKSASLSMSGKNLPSFIKNMTEQENEKFIYTLRELLGLKIDKVSTETQKKTWMDLC